MSHMADEFIHDAIHADRATDQFELGIGGILKNEMVEVEITEFGSANAPGQLSI